jgi:phenylacetic acid degradation protein
MPFYEIDGLIPVVDPSSFVHPTAVLIGDVIVGPNCYIAPGASMRGDFGRLVMHAGCNLQDNCVVHGFPNTDTVLEEDAHIGHGAILHGCVIRRNALVGMGAVIMDGAEIGEDSFIAALAFVKANMKVPPRSLVAGIPGKVVRQVTQQEIDWKKQGTREYQDLAKRSHATMREVQPLTAPEPDRKRFDLSVTPPLYMVKGGS